MANQFPVPRSRVTIDVSTGTIIRILLILLAVWFFYVILDILLMLLAAIILTAAIEPLVNNLQQRFKVPRLLSIAIVYITILIVVVTIVSLLVQPLTEQSVQLANAIPTTFSKLHRYIPLIPSIEPATWQQSIQEALRNFGNNLANVSFNVFQQTKSVVSALVSVIFSFVMALYLMVEKDALQKLARIITPRAHLPYVEQVIVRVQLNIGRWVLAQMTLGAIVGVAIGLIMWALGIKYALLLGLLSGLLEFIPVMGPITAGIPGVILGLSQSLTLGLVVLVVYIVVQQLENHFLVPNIMRRAIGLNPLVTIIAILLGARLAGLSGVILSVPVATILSVILSDIFTQPAPEDELAG